ncbi:MAG TPA: TIGR03067 domain-containing protein [Gemmataceae bacterium]|nr:TIGR03067 domain-containing protein [Gemmataceae bacterium]
MVTRTCLLLCFAAISAADDKSDAAKLKADLADLQGVWRLIGFEVDGQEALLQEHKQLRWVIKEDNVFYGGEELAKLTLVPAAMPKCLDLGLLKSKGVLEAIYQRDEDRLKICVNISADGVKERPSRFDNEGIEKFRTLLFVRDKPGTELEGAAGFVGVQLRADEQTKEIQIVETIKDGPAEKAGLNKDDVLLKVSGDAAADLKQTVNLLRQFKPGSDAVLRVRRAGKEQDITIKVGVAPFLFFNP